MKRSLPLYTALVASVAGVAAAYLFGTESGTDARHTARRVARDRADDSARWLRERGDDVNARLGRIEDQIDHLGVEMRRRLDALQQQAAGALHVPADPGTDWPKPEDLRDLSTINRRD